MIQIIFATLIDDPHEVIQGRPRIGKDPVNLPWDQRRPDSRCYRYKERRISPLLSSLVQIAFDLEISFADPMRLIAVAVMSCNGKARLGAPSICLVQLFVAVGCGVLE